MKKYKKNQLLSNNAVLQRVYVLDCVKKVARKRCENNVKKINEITEKKYQKIIKSKNLCMFVIIHVYEYDKKDRCLLTNTKKNI